MKDMKQKYDKLTFPNKKSAMQCLKRTQCASK